MDNGKYKASMVKFAKMAAAFSHFCPNNTSVMGCANAQHNAVIGKLSGRTALIKLHEKHDDIVEARSCNRDNAGMNTAVIGLMTCSKGLISNVKAREYKPTAPWAIKTAD